MGRRTKYVWSRVPEILLEVTGDPSRARLEADRAAGIVDDRPVKDMGLRRHKGEFCYVTRQLREP